MKFPLLATRWIPARHDDAATDAEELLAGVGGKPGESIRNSLEHVIAVLRG